MDETRIPLAPAVRWRRIRSQTIPVLTFVAAVAATGWLWRFHGLGAQAIGEVDSPRVDITSPAAGLVVTMANDAQRHWSVYDYVRAGDVIAQIDGQQTGSTGSTELVDVPAPISGTLVAVHCWPGQMLPPGGLIATIAADHGRHIVGYVPEESRLTPRAGMEVTLRTRRPGSPRLESEIEEVGQQIERIPRHQRQISTTPQWGTPVRIKLPNDATLKPGSLVDIFFDGARAR